MKKNLTTPAGQMDSDERVNAINQVFAIFRRNYHNQYYKAFPSDQDAGIAKRLWLDSLARFSPESILRGTKSLIEQSEYLPTLAAMIKHCEAAEFPELPDAHSAYVEACRAPSPKADFSWSHPAVYYAGKKSDWYFLASSSEDIAFPVFKQHYLAILARLRSGETLSPPNHVALNDHVESHVDKEKNREHLARLKAFINE